MPQNSFYFAPAGFFFFSLINGPERTFIRLQLKCKGLTYLNNNYKFIL